MVNEYVQEINKKEHYTRSLFGAAIQTNMKVFCTVLGVICTLKAYVAANGLKLLHVIGIVTNFCATITAMDNSAFTSLKLIVTVCHNRNCCRVCSCSQRTGPFSSLQVFLQFI